MGFLIFAYRKLYLKSKINDLSYQALILSQKKQTVTSQIGSLEEMMNSGKQSLSLFQNTEMGQLQQSLYKKYGTMDEKTGQYTFNKGMDNTGYNMEMNNQMQMLQQKYAYANSVFDQQEKGMLNRLHMEDKQIEQQLASIDTQTKQLTPELEEVIKGEDAAAKSEAPKFGLS